MKKYTKESIQKMLAERYGDKYEVIEYTWSKSPVIIKCKIHGKFTIRLDHIRQEKGEELCQKCRKEKERIKKFKEFEKLGKQIHDNKYVYHLESFTKMSAPTTITCPTHGNFSQIAESHIWAKQGCPKCADERKKGKYKYSREEIVEMCKKVHGDKYIYDDIIFQGMKSKILNIKCHKHGYFDQIAYDHIRGFGCEKCKFDSQTMTKEEFIKRATTIHNGFYKYNTDKITYINNHIKIPIICPIHGEFWQRPAYHLMGGGCNECNLSKLENEVKITLQENGIVFESQKRFIWLGRLSLDFYLPEYNIAIECQGMQHFEDIKHFNSSNKDSLEARKERDKRKRMLCNEHGIKLLYYSNLGINYPYEVFEDKEKLLQEIRSTT